MTQDAAALREQKQLQKLRRLREDSARRLREHCRLAVEAAAEAVRSKEASIRSLRQQLDRLRAWAPVSGDRRIDVQADMNDARVLRLREQIDAEEQSLATARQALAEAETQLAQAHTAWTVACTKQQSVDDWVLRSRRLMALDAERRAEREVDAAGRGAHGTLSDIGADGGRP